MLGSSRPTRGMSLVEVTIVIVVLGVIMAAVFMFFISGTEHFHFARRQSELDTAGRLALDRMTNEIIWAGFMPQGGWDNDEWHPIAAATEDSLSFFSDFKPYQVLDDEDYRDISHVNSMIRIADHAGREQFTGEFVSDLTFEYFDASGAELPTPVGEASRDLIRHIGITLELTASYSGDVYQTVLHTTISPRNLGVNHNINPAFFPPAPMDGTIVVNIRGDSANPDPTADEQAFIDVLQRWGLSVAILTDDQLAGFNYSDVDAMILRNIPGGVSHGNPAFLQALPVPIIITSAYDAWQVFGMGTGAFDLSVNTMTILEDGPPNFNGLPGDPGETFMVYELMSGGTQSVLTGMPPDGGGDTLFICAGSDSSLSGVYAVNSDSADTRRIHLSAYQASKYTKLEGWELFYNLILWQLQAGHSVPGSPITITEDFEGPGVSSVPVTLWTDFVEPTAGVDTVPLYTETFSGGTTLPWTFLPLGGGRVFVNGTFLQTDRAAAGPVTRNIATVSVDLSAYDEFTDDLVLSVRSASYEGFADADDGVFFVTFDSPVQMADVSFETLGNAPGDLTIGGDSYYRYRIHSPSGWLGDGQFITFDTRTSGTYASNRMMIETSTAGVYPGQPITISYRFHDHTDEDHSGTTGDFIGWNSHGVLMGTANLIANLTPSAWNNNYWHDRSVVFAAPNPLPNPLYILFGQRGNRQATTLTSTDGISLDNIVITAPGDSTYTRIQEAAPTSTWTEYVTDLDEAARNAGVEFGAAFPISISQSGGGPVPSSGRLWDDVTISVLQPGLYVDGWEHGVMTSGMNDDWYPKSIIPVLSYSWATQPASSGSYRNNAWCYLTTPSIPIPSWIENPVFQFSSQFSTQSGYDGGFVQISVDGGAWTTLTSASGLAYSTTSLAGFPGGTGIQIFSGTRALSTETVNLTPYLGHTVRFRFLFGSNGSTTGTGWLIDNFMVSGTATGYQINALQFDVADLPAGWSYFVDVYMGSGTDSLLASPGEWNEAAMTQVVDDGFFTVGTGGWNTLVLSTPYMLPPGANLYIKIEQQDAGFAGMPITFNCSDLGVQQRCRSAYSDVMDPVLLSPRTARPDIRLEMPSGLVEVSGGLVADGEVPVNNLHLWSDCELIYTAEDLGLGGGVGTWIHGGAGDEWEIGAPAFLAVDPPLDPLNGEGIAGTDLTVNGYYLPNSWNWFVSPAYPMPGPGLYDTVVVDYYRCLKLASNDAGYLHMAFTTAPTPPAPGSSDWKLVETFDGVNNVEWDWETIDVTSEFLDGWGAGRTYFFVRFLLFSGPFGERGGWNLDNITFYAE